MRSKQAVFQLKLALALSNKDSPNLAKRRAFLSTPKDSTKLVPQQLPAGMGAWHAAKATLVGESEDLIRCLSGCFK